MGVGVSVGVWACGRVRVGVRVRVVGWMVARRVRVGARVGVEAQVGVCGCSGQWWVCTVGLAMGVDGCVRRLIRVCGLSVGVVVGVSAGACPRVHRLMWACCVGQRGWEARAVCARVRCERTGVGES